MAECDYCGASFDDEDAYVRHLGDEHADDLGPIESRRVAELESDGGGRDAVVYGVGLGALALGGLLAYLLFFSGGAGTTGSNGGGGPTDVGSVHYHGTIDATVGGQRLDFSQQRFQLQDRAFHFENGNGERWHVHAKGVTLAYAMQTLGVDVTNDTVAYDGTTYGDDPGESVTVTVNGESVTPAEYVLQQGDSVRIAANASG
ncbi:MULTISPECIES: hypothetical protein [Halorussus]|uniref:hypothetical protein n=1 Tax=Halorussus TaxID=1070314 RepID=UPI000E214033|nr:MULTISPECIES: hypothetical protein [Halorussus]NHN60201.1 hypothetical protein [Halorussus sp. JP-T4]